MKKLLGILVLGLLWFSIGYAHVAICVRSKFKKSYKEIEDERLQEVIEYIERLKNNPS